MRTRRNAGDNGYQSAVNYANEGHGYEPRTSYSDQYRTQRDNSDYRGQGSDNDEANNMRNASRRDVYGSSDSNRSSANDSQNREWSNHRSGWNDNGSSFSNRDHDRDDYRSDGRNDSRDYNRSYRNGSDQWDNNNERHDNDYRRNNYNGYGQNGSNGNGRSYQGDSYNGNWQNDQRNGQYGSQQGSQYNSQNDFLEDQGDSYGRNRMSNRNGYNENPNNDNRHNASNGNYQYGNDWSRDRNSQGSDERRSRQGFGSSSKDRR